MYLILVSLYLILCYFYKMSPPPPKLTKQRETTLWLLYTRRGALTYLHDIVKVRRHVQHSVATWSNYIAVMSNFSVHDILKKLWNKANKCYTPIICRLSTESETSEKKYFCRQPTRSPNSPIILSTSHKQLHLGASNLY